MAICRRKPLKPEVILYFLLVGHFEININAGKQLKDIIDLTGKQDVFIIFQVFCPQHIL